MPGFKILISNQRSNILIYIIIVVWMKRSRSCNDLQILAINENEQERYKRERDFHLFMCLFSLTFSHTKITQKHTCENTNLCVHSPTYIAYNVKYIWWEMHTKGPLMQANNHKLNRDGCHKVSMKHVVLLNKTARFRWQVWYYLRRTYYIAHMDRLTYSVNK